MFHFRSKLIYRPPKINLGGRCLKILSKFSKVHLSNLAKFFENLVRAPKFRWYILSENQQMPNLGGVFDFRLDLDKIVLLLDPYVVVQVLFLLTFLWQKIILQSMHPCHFSCLHGV